MRRWLLLALGLLAACRGAPRDEARRAAPSAVASAQRACDAPISPFEGTRGAFIGTRFGPLKWYELGADGSEAALSTDDLRHPCDPAWPRLLVLRLDAPWCGTCIASADRFADALRSFGGALLTFDLVFSGADNGPPQLEDVRAWRAAHPTLPGHLARSADAATGQLLRFQRVSPAVFLVRLPTMTILDVLANPTTDVLEARVRRALATARDEPFVAAEPAKSALVDGRFSPEDWALLQGMRAGAPPPPDPSNGYADDPAAARLGAMLFTDTALGGGAKVACATCHVPARAFSDGRPTSHGAGDGEVNALGLGPAAYNRWWFWDGRADSLWAQATSPLENPKEMDGTRLGVAHRIARRHREGYERVFGPLPELSDAKRFPPAGKPGTAAFDAMAPEDREATTRVFVNAAKAIAAFERTLRPRRSRLEDYLGGDFHALTEQERDGMKLFLTAGCAVCHHGPMLTDGAFHDIHMPASSQFGPALRGRVDGVRTLLGSAFRRDGPYSDAPDADTRLRGLAALDSMLGQVKTPSLRDVELTAPWGHGGTFKTLEDVVGHYDIDELTSAGPARSGALDPAVPAFAASDAQQAAVVAFLRAVGGGQPSSAKRAQALDVASSTGK